MTTQVYDVIIIVAGRPMLPAATILARAGLRPMIIDQFASRGQGTNKTAVGGIPATHLTPAKIRLCLQAIDAFFSWQAPYGDDVEWYQGGYAFVADHEREDQTLKDLLHIQRTYRLDIRWLDRDDLLDAIPDGSPIVGWAGGLQSFIHAIGMCGQGRMLGPGVGALLARMFRGELTPEDEDTLAELSPYHDFGRRERLA